MSFLSPIMLIGLLSAGLPILIHLLRRRTAGRVLWGAWMFLFESIKRKHRKLMIEDVLLLVLRTLLIISAVLAFSRPFLKEIRLFGIAGCDKDVVIVIDTSASMRLSGAGGRSLFDQAIEEACELVRLSPEGTAFGIVCGESTPAILTSAPISDKREITALIEKIKPTSDAMDVPRTLAAAGEVLSGGNNPAKEIIIFGDGQGYGWRPGEKTEWARVERIFDRFPVRPPVIWRSLLRPEKVRNAAIAAVEPSRGVIGTDRPVSFTVSVINSGSEAYAPGDVVFSVDGDEKGRQPVGQILPGLSRTFTFSHRFEKSGLRKVVTSLSNADDIMSDSTLTNTVDVIEKINVMIVDGRSDATGYNRAGAFVEAALSPSRRGSDDVFLARPRSVWATSLENEKCFEGVHATVLCDVPMLSPGAMTNLVGYVRGGGSLVCLLGALAEESFYTNALFAASWTNRCEGVANVTFKGAPVTMRVMFDEKSLPKSAETPWRYSDGEIAGVVAPFGRGRVVTLGFPLDFSSTTFPARPAFVPFVHELIYASLATNFVSASCDSRWRAREGDLKELTEEELDELAVSIDLGIARRCEDALAAVVGRSFGLEIWRPFAVLALLLLVAEYLLCRRFDAERGGRIKSHALFALRTAAFAAIVWQLMHISWVHDVNRRIHRRVVVVTDHSLSMARGDSSLGTNALSRLEVATNLASVIDKRLSRRYDVVPYAFGSSSTDFAQALENILDEVPGEELSGVVFLTDGCDTREGCVAAASRRIARAGARISTVLIGSTSNRVDAAVTAVDVAETVYLGDKIRPTARLAAYGMKGRTLGVYFKSGDEVIEKRDLEVDADEWNGVVRFTHDPLSKGVGSYSVSIVPPEGDSEEKNDLWPFTVAVSDDRTNVIVVDRRPRWEFRYLRNLFHARDKSVHLQYVITEPDRIAAPSGPPAPPADASREFGDAEAGSLPVTYDDWRKFNVIVIGDIPPSVFDEEARCSVKRAVEERGAMLVVIAGEKHMPRDYVSDAFAKLLPAAFTNSLGETTAQWIACSTPFALTPSGAAHPVTALSVSASENARVWNSLPPIAGRLSGFSVSPGAEVLLFGGDSTALDSPLLIVSEMGRGKVAFLATDETWRLRYRAGDRYHHRFWGNLVNWGFGEKLRDGNLHARVGTDKMHVLPGEKVKISVRLVDGEFNPVTNALPVAVVTAKGGSSHRITLSRRPGGNGYYEAFFDETSLEGRYSVEIEDKMAEAALGALWPGKLSTHFVSSTSLVPVEYVSLKADSKIPSQMARITGGHVYTSPCDPSLFDKAFGAGSVDVTERVEDPIWNHPSALVILLVALAALWILRKLRGLA